MTTGLTVDVETTPESPDWDSFVAATPGGHHAQTSGWTSAKEVLGWDAARLVVRRDGEIVAGIQLLMRKVGRIGWVGFAPRGPLLPEHDRAALELLHAALMDYARAHAVLYLKVQPPTNRYDLVPLLRGLGWTPSALEAAPTATLRVDLTPSTDELLACMRRTTRQHIRQGESRGLRVRVGGESDLEPYYHMVQATSQRQRFAAYPLSYYATMWRAFASGDHACLLMAELDDQLLSSALVIAFGDTATCKMAGWSGERARVSPNQPMHWTAMRWAKERGYRWYDFDGIERDVAAALQSGGDRPESGKVGVPRFKQGFGGEIVVFPEALDSSPYRTLRPVVRIAAPRTDRLSSIAMRALGRGGD